MAKSPTPAAKAGTHPAALDPDRHYPVKLSRPVSVQGRVLMPRHQHTIRGDHLEAMSPEDREAITILPE
jgi:hypothetical protein